MKMQHIVLLLCLFIPLLSRNCFGVVKSESNEIGKLLKNGQPVLFDVTLPCIEKATKKIVEPADRIKQLFAFATCQISNSASGSEPPRVMVHDDNEENVNIGTSAPATDLRFRAMLLYQFPNTVSYMILDPQKGHWFFTAELSGCDIFIATKASQPNMPMVFHANLDELYKTEQQVDNLRWKGDKVDQILGAFQMNYVLKVRIHITPEKPIPSNYDQYWNVYKTTHPIVKVYRYVYNDALTFPQTQFYGYYENGWKFFLKAKQNGVKSDIPV
ncbi:Hypothetical predicted protein [Paramuricea clavata]|uniref:Uncharacterized protein n=1 Tax=Paramuricea clavata TaxID=317549 RepID=A0A7D9IWP5_PARCT|nr:Hypothetical predicted protein [Paramuricea clavata]